jgi:hypothetical protein
MSKKYISQINNTNFVFPNYKLAEYDVEIIHEIKDNSVSGSTTGFDMSYNSGTGNISISFTYQWYLNSAEPFISNDGKLNILSVHMMTNDKKYFKPWICVGLIQDNNTSLTYKTDTQNFVVTPQMVGQASFTNGTYFAEIRMMGHRAVFPLNYSDTVSGITVTPTPTPTVTPTPTPTATPGLSPTPTPTPTPTNAYELYSADRYECDTPSGPCTYVETLDIANPTVLNTGKFYLDSINGYIFNIVGGPISGPYLYTSMGGLGTNNCSSLCSI